MKRSNPFTRSVIQDFENSSKGKPRTVAQLPENVVPYRVLDVVTHDDGLVELIVKYVTDRERRIPATCMETKAELRAALKVARPREAQVLKRIAQNLDLT